MQPLHLHNVRDAWPQLQPSIRSFASLFIRAMTILSLLFAFFGLPIFGWILAAMSTDICVDLVPRRRPLLCGSGRCTAVEDYRQRA